MKKVLVIGATGLLGSAIVEQLSGQANLVTAARSGADYQVDITNKNSLAKLFKAVGKVDAIICTAGIAHFKALTEMDDQDWQFAISNKMMGQINIVREGADYINEGGSIVLTTGTLAQTPIPGSSIVSAVNAAVEGAIRAFSLELEHLRINAVSPGWISETLSAMNMDPAQGIPAKKIATTYIATIEASNSGDIVAVG
ncbi:MAG: short chain dehydrogenase [Psychrobium sp.]